MMTISLLLNATAWRSERLAAQRGWSTAQDYFSQPAQASGRGLGSAGVEDD